MSEQPTADHQLTESLASLLTRYALLQGLDGDGLLLELEKMLEGMGYRCVEGVWLKGN